MCRFFSCLVSKTGHVKWHPLLDSHSDIMRYYAIDDTRVETQVVPRWAKIEFVPEQGADWTDPETWTLTVDEQTEPEWWPGVADKVRTELVRICRGFIHTTGSRDLVIGERLILAGDAQIQELRGCVVACMYGSSKVVDMCDSSKVVHMYGSSKVVDMSDSSKVVRMSDSSKVVDMSDSSKVVRMSDSSKVDYMSDSSKVDYMSDSSKVDYMYGSSKVVHMYDSSKVVHMYGSSKVDYMSDSSKVDYMYDSSKVENDLRQTTA